MSQSSLCASPLPHLLVRICIVELTNCNFCFFREYLGVKKIVWLGLGLYKDVDTNGHVDNILSYVSPGVVVLAWTDDTSDPQYPISVDAYNRLSAATDAMGRKFTIHKMHIVSEVIN